MRDIGVVASVVVTSSLVVPDADGSRALALAEAARTAVEAAAPMRGSLRCSAGIACFPEDARNAGALLQLADGALSWAKDAGRGRSRRYDPEHVFVVTEEQREDFSQMIGRADALTPVFQPIVSLTTGETVGFEALARFQDKPALPPSWWFSQAHRFGLGAALEAEAVRMAIDAPERPSGCFLSVNLSPSALASPEVNRLLPDELRGLVVEITEEERVLDVAALQRHLDPLRARGATSRGRAGEGTTGCSSDEHARESSSSPRVVADATPSGKIALIGSLALPRSTSAVICARGSRHSTSARDDPPAWPTGRAGARPPAVRGRLDPRRPAVPRECAPSGQGRALGPSASASPC